MSPDHLSVDFGFMLISTDSPTLLADGLSRYPHSAGPQCWIRTDPVFPSVCQSPSGISAGSSSFCMAFNSFGAASATGGTRAVGISIGGVVGVVTGAVDVTAGGLGGGTTGGTMAGGATVVDGCAATTGAAGGGAADTTGSATDLFTGGTAGR